MSNDTSNALTDFDMCLALAQKAINSQMTAAWDTWIARSEFSNIEEMQDFALVDIFPLKKNGKPSSYGLSAEFAPLTVSLYVPNSKLGQVKVTLHLQSGTVTYYDEDEEEKASYDIQNWSVSFLTDLDKTPCDLATLKRIDPNVGDSAEKVIAESGLPDSVFSIEYLFMKFTEVDLLLSDNKNINIPSDAPDGARTKALTCLNKMLQGDTGEFMMGTVVRRSKTNSLGPLPTFALTDFIFNVKADDVPDASTLSYLGMFSKRSLPDNIDTARIALQDNWVRPEMLDGTKGSISGTMAISQYTFFDRYLIPKFTNGLGVSPQKAGLTWTYDLPAKTTSKTKKDIVERYYTTSTEATLKLTIEPGSNQLKITGSIDGHANYDSYTISPIDAVTGIFGGKTDTRIHEAWVHLAGSQDISATVNLTASGGTEDFKVNVDIPEEDYFGKVSISKNETKGTAVLTEGNNVFTDMIKGIAGSTPNEMIGSLQKSERDSMRTVVDDALDQIDMNLNNQSFIPPGGGVFTFQNLRFSDAGDLLFDVIYKAP